MLYFFDDIFAPSCYERMKDETSVLATLLFGNIQVYGNSELLKFPVLVGSQVSYQICDGILQLLKGESEPRSKP